MTEASTEGPGPPRGEAGEKPENGQRGGPGKAARSRGSIGRKMAEVRNKVRELKWTVLAMYLARKDPRVPRKAKIAMALAIAYALSPIDIIPDFIPVIGQLDDLIIIPALVGYAVKSMPPGILDEYRIRAKEEFASGKPKAYAMAAVVIAIWGSLFALIVWKVALPFIIH